MFPFYSAREFGTYTHDLRNLVLWLKEEGCEPIAMESTGSYWKLLLNIPEASQMLAMIVNATHTKAVPGRKTDVSDAQWIADLLQHGLLKAGFIPDREQRELRELTRYCKSRMEKRAREINCLQKMLEGANIKLSNTLTNIISTTSRKMLSLAIGGEPISREDVERCMRGNPKSSTDDLLLSLEGIIIDLQRDLISEVLHVIDEQTALIQRAENLSKKYMKANYASSIESIDELPGISVISAQQIIAEIGTDISRFLFQYRQELCAIIWLNEVSRQ